MFKGQLVFLILILTVTGGCSVNAGKKEVTSEPLVSQIQPHLTTKTRVLRLFGQPHKKQMNETSETWVYQYVKNTRTGASYIPVVSLFAHVTTVETTSLSVLIGNDGIVKKVNHDVKTCDYSVGKEVCRKK